MSSNLPVSSSDSTLEVKEFFDKFYQSKVSFPSDQIDAVVGFFLSKGFDVQSARSTGIVLLNQARVDNVNVLQLIESLKSLTDVQLSQVVAQVLNAYRESTSLLGYRIEQVGNEFESRNILV